VALAIPCPVDIGSRTLLPNIKSQISHLVIFFEFATAKIFIQRCQQTITARYKFLFSAANRRQPLATNFSEIITIGDGSYYKN
jgi:hypothetical protein